MSDNAIQANDLIRYVREREKELECMYQIEKVLQKADASLEDICLGVAAAIQAGWQHSDVCRAKINLENQSYHAPDFKETPWVQQADILVQGKKTGTIGVYYLAEMPTADIGPFLKQEARLLENIADRLGDFVARRQVMQTIEESRSRQQKKESDEWRVVLDLIRNTDKTLFANISERMLNQLCWSGISEAARLRDRTGRNDQWGDDNVPSGRQDTSISESMSAEIFRIAANYYSDDEILAHLQKWILDDNFKFLLRVVDRNLTLAEVVHAVQRYRQVAPEGVNLSPTSKRHIAVSLINRFLSTHLKYVDLAKNYLEIEDFFDLLDRVIYAPDSHGRLGGKTAGWFLAKQILKKVPDPTGLLRQVKTPKSWYLTSDLLVGFMLYNNLDDIVDQKYKDINQVRVEYPHVIRTFKNGRFPPEVVQGLSMALDDFGNVPIVVRSSSLLEDSFGASFSGKYKSFFLANQGSKKERLTALMDSIAEVYASTFGPDPIEYRAERGLLDFIEGMGILIQEVVGTRVGDYFLPAFAGVAFSRNEFRWSSRIKREDGLIRLVPGLGTRAVDRVGDDYPMLLAPGQPGLRVNVTADEIAYYSPKKVDVINLKKNSFETMDAADLLREHGAELPLIEKLVSVYEDHHLRRPLSMSTDFSAANLAFTFDGLISDPGFVQQMDTILKTLERNMGMPVDIEFAHDGQNLYLLQCRAQSYSEDSVPAPIPQDIPHERIIFSANRYVSNGRVPDITHIVYVVPEKYGELSDRSDLLAVGRAVGRLNKLLPKRQFVLMGPGRWGSRGDIKLGVNVTYSDINNTALLVEIAQKKGDYMPDLSFGTHFFQDLVEARIRYLPLYPDEPNIEFNRRFLLGATNLLPTVLPEFKFLAETVRLIDVSQSANGSILRVLMNADLNAAVGILTTPGAETEVAPQQIVERSPGQNFWLWRLRMAEHIASQLDTDRFGVVGLYLIGSTKNATAGPQSDIDLLVHFRGTPRQLEDLQLWFEGWSLCLDEMNYLRTGYRCGGLLDVHFVSDEDFIKKTSYTVKVGAATDAARPLPIKKMKQ